MSVKAEVEGRTDARISAVRERPNPGTPPRNIIPNHKVLDGLAILLEPAATQWSVNLLNSTVEGKKQNTHLAIISPQPSPIPPLSSV